MSLIKKLSARLQNHPKRIVFPEGEDIRVIQASRKFVNQKLGVAMLIGSKKNIENIAAENNVSLDGIRVIEICHSDDYESMLNTLCGVPHFRTMDREEVEKLLNNANYFATLMLATAKADAMIAGATMSSSNALRPILRLIPMQEGIKVASSMLVADTGKEDLGVNGFLFMADCGVIVDPTEDQLAEFAITTAKIMNHLTDESPRVAMLSFATKLPIAKTSSILKVKAATSLAHAKALNEKSCEIFIDGEMQVDAALSPEVAKSKGVNSSVAGRANVLIFPDLNAGNIATKFLSALVGMRCYSNILTGLTRPVAEISRGATVDDIFGTAVIVAAQAVDKKYLYPTD